MHQRSLVPFSGLNRSHPRDALPGASFSGILKIDSQNMALVLLLMESPASGLEAGPGEDTCLRGMRSILWMPWHHRAAPWHEPMADRAIPLDFPPQRKESRQQGREQEARGQEGERSLERGIPQVWKVLHNSQGLKGAVTGGGRAWQQLPRAVNVPTAFPSACLCHLPTITHNLSPQEPAISHSAACACPAPPFPESKSPLSHG